MKTLLFSMLSCILGIMGCKEAGKKQQPLVSDTAAVNEKIQTENITITPIEHATAVLKWGGTVIYVDPVGGAAAFEGQPDPDLILITDIHGDHLDPATLTALNTQKSKIVVPKAVAEKLPAELNPMVNVLNNGESKKFLDIQIEAIPMYNLREEAKDFHVKGRGNGYVLEKDGSRIYFSGDTEDIPEMRALENIDKAFVCMNLPYTMTVDSAASAVLDFAPKEVYPYHYRGRPDVSDVGRFKKIVNEGNPDIEVVQLDWYPKEAY